MILCPHYVVCHIWNVSSPQEQEAPKFAGWWLRVRDSHFQSHISLWSFDYVMSYDKQKRYISTCTRLTSTKLHTVVTKVEGFPFTRSCVWLIMWSRNVSWQIRNVYLQLHKTQKDQTRKSGELGWRTSTQKLIWPFITWSLNAMWEIRNVSPPVLQDL